MTRSASPVSDPRSRMPADLAAAVRDAAGRLAGGARSADVRRAMETLEAGCGAGAPSRRTLLSLLRSELTRLWSAAPEPPDAAAMLATLRAFDRADAQLSAGDRPAAERNGDDAAAGPLELEGAELIAEVAHDLRSPLTSILFLAETLRLGQSGPVNDVQRQQLSIVYSATLGLISVASDMIELVQGGNRLMENTPHVFSVTEMLESVRDIVQPMAEEKGLSVQLFPPSLDRREGYPLALNRVLLNLTTNGLKFTEQGFVEITVRETGPSTVEFSVRDTGNGFSPEAVETLYQPFRPGYRGRRYGFSGTGLGLAISRRLVEAMGATLQVESRPTWGTRFYFEIELPAAPAG